MRLKFTIFVWCLMLSLSSASAEFKKNTLLELYSSESCSSCPPADMWMSRLKDDKRVFKTVFPVVFHVDYWNNLGWIDQLSDEEMTERQVSLAKLWPKSSVYTPGFIVNGNEWKNWHKTEIPISGGSSLYELTFKQTKGLNFTVNVKTGSSGKENLIVRMALLGFGIESDVAAGENSGKKLTHDFAVLKWGWKTYTAGTTINFMFSNPKLNFKKLAVVTWLEKAGNPIPLQVTGGYIK